MPRTVIFYRTADGKCPIEDFLDDVPSKVAQKIVWVLRLLEELELVPSTYLSKLSGTNEIWECRIAFSSNAYRILCFFVGQSSVVLTNGFMKKTNKTPRGEIEKAEAYRRDYLERNSDHERP